MTTDEDENNTQSSHAGSTCRLHGDMKKYSVIKTVAAGTAKSKWEKCGKKHGMSAVPVMLQCTQGNVSLDTIPKRSVCTDIPGNSTFHISAKSIQK